MCPLGAQMPARTRPQLRQGNAMFFDISQCVETKTEKDLRVSTNQSVYGKQKSTRSFTVEPPQTKGENQNDQSMVRTAVAAGPNHLQTHDDDDESDCSPAKSDSDSSLGLRTISTDSCRSDIKSEILSDQPARPQLRQKKIGAAKSDCIRGPFQAWS